jgi:hypothetical protein
VHIYGRYGSRGCTPKPSIADYDYLPEDKDLQLVQSAIQIAAIVKWPWYHDCWENP